MERLMSFYILFVKTGQKIILLEITRLIFSHFFFSIQHILIMFSITK